MLSFFCFSASASRDVTTVALGRNVLPHRGDGLTGNDFRANGRLQGNRELLPRMNPSA